MVEVVVKVVVEVEVEVEVVVEGVVEVGGVVEVAKMKLIVQGSIPGKKNAYAQDKKGRRYKPREIKKQIDAIVWQLLLQAGNIESFEQPIIKAHFTCKTYRKDLDNMYTTLQDAMVQAGVLINDNLTQVRDVHMTASVDKYADEKCVIDITDNPTQ
jgi:Holliday junction resolvase RusA-like endonuclease